MDSVISPLRAAVNQVFGEDEVPDRLLRKSVELMLERGIEADEIAAKLLEWAVIAARAAGEPDLWRVAFARSGEMIED